MASRGRFWSIHIEENEDNAPKEEIFNTGDTYDVTARSLLFFALDSEANTA